MRICKSKSFAELPGRSCACDRRRYVNCLRDDNKMIKRWAVVTGASSGIGMAFATELSRRGHPVLAVARRRDRLEALAKVAANREARIEPLTADLITDEGLRSVT